MRRQFLPCHRPPKSIKLGEQRVDGKVDTPSAASFIAIRRADCLTFSAHNPTTPKPPEFLPVKP